MQSARLQEWILLYAPAAAPTAAPLDPGELRQATRLLLSALLPPHGSPARRRLELGAPLGIEHSSQQRRALTALVALLTRSLKTPDAVGVFLECGSDTASLSLARRLMLLLCAAVAAGAQPDTVLDAAAARSLELLLAPSVAGGSGGGAGSHVQHVSHALLTVVAVHPGPLLCAIRRAVAAASVGTAGPSSSPSKAPGSISASAGEQQGWYGWGVTLLFSFFVDLTSSSCKLLTSSAVLITCAVMVRLFSTAVAAMEQQQAPQQHPQQQAEESATPYVCAFTETVMSVPGLVACLPEVVASRLLRRATLSALLLAAMQVQGPANTLHGSRAAAVLGNIAHLLLAPPGQKPASAAADLLALPASPHLADRAMAEAACRAVLQLLPAAVAGPMQVLSSSETDVVGAQLALLAAQRPLLQLLAVLSEAMPLYAALCLHLLQDLPTLDERLRSAKPDAAASGGGSSSSNAVGSGSSSSSVSVLNTLAFTPQVLPALWRWLALNIGLPLEAPAGARLGLDVAAVSGGCRALSPTHALVLGVFCRCGRAACTIAARFVTCEFHYTPREGLYVQSSKFHCMPLPLCALFLLYHYCNPTGFLVAVTPFLPPES